MGRFAALCIAVSISACIAADATAQSNGPTATLVVEAYDANGAAVGLTDFVSITNYVASDKWNSYQQYGVFPLGVLPATLSLASGPSPDTNGGAQVFSFQVPANLPLYFTSVWKAPGIGTVFMRADNGGSGYLLAVDQRQVLQLPYEFAGSEYELANKMLSDASGTGYTFSADVLSLAQSAATLVQNARSSTTAVARALASYQALSVVMRLKEQIVIEMSNADIARNGRRNDFELNYEGFGSWTDTRFVQNYTRAKSAGFTSVLTSCNWNQISPAQGTYDFAILDYQIDQAAALGYKVTLTINQSLGAMPSWVGNLPFSDLRSVFVENARRVVARYKDKVSLFYADAEPELTVQGHTLAQMGDLTRASLEGARAAASDRQFGLYLSASAYVGYQMNPSVGADYYSSWDLLNYLATSHITPDFIGLEMQYATVFAPIDLQRFQEILRAVSSVSQVPVYIGETAYSSKAEDYGINEEFYWHQGLTEQAQAEWADGVMRIAYGSPFVKGLYWVHLDPDNNDFGSAFLSSLIGTGLFTADGTAKRSYAALKSFADARTPFTDDILTAGVTLIRLVHIDELRQRIDTVRAKYDLGPYSYTHVSLTAQVSPVSALDITEMRAALAQAYTAAGRTVPGYSTNPTIGGVMQVADITDLRSALVALEF